MEIFLCFSFLSDPPAPAAGSDQLEQQQQQQQQWRRRQQLSGVRLPLVPAGRQRPGRTGHGGGQAKCRHTLGGAGVCSNARCAR
jgi:hypothetical protein